MVIIIDKKINSSDNPSWPPLANSIIILYHPEYKKTFIGKLHALEWNNTIGILILLDRTKHVDTFLVKNGLIPSGYKTHGFILLLPSYGWRYLTEHQMRELLDLANITNLQSIHNLIKHNYDKLLLHKPQLVPVPVPVPVMQSDLETEAIYSDPQKEKKVPCHIIEDEPDFSLLNEKGELQLDNLFTEKEINNYLSNDAENFYPLKDKFKTMILNRLHNVEKIDNLENLIIVNKNIAINNLIDNAADEQNEGLKISSYFLNMLINIKTDGMKLFGDLKMNIFNGYVHIGRKGKNVNDIITLDMIPNLKYFSWQYGAPIDYDTLKYVLFQSPIQRGIRTNVEEQKEAELIFMQEYLIAMQPEPKYQIWCLKRLIMAWYADTVLQNNIRKIKVLINQYRCKSDQPFNKQYGILPSIVVYPRYGKISARLVLQKISEYFLLYQNIGWKCSTPSYFVKINNLIWYTNGNIDLKLYFRKTKQSYDTKVDNLSFKNNYTSIADAPTLVFTD